MTFYGGFPIILTRSLACTCMAKEGGEVILVTLYANQNGLLESSDRNILYWRYCIQGRVAHLQGESMREGGPSCVLCVYCCTYIVRVMFSVC